MADRREQHDIDPQLEDRLRSYRDRIAYPSIGDSASAARQRIESSSATPAVPPIPAPAPFDGWDDEPTDEINAGRIVDIREGQLPNKLRQILGLAAAAVAVLVAGATLIAVLPDVRDDGSPAVLGPDTTGYEFAGTIGGSLIPNEPVDVALDSDGNIYAADLATASIHKFDRAGELLGSFTAEDSEFGAFVRPWSVAIDDDTLYVLDQGQVAIYALDLDGNVRRSWSVGDPEDETMLFSGIDVNQHGHVYTAKANEGVIAVYQSDGAPITELQITNDPKEGSDRPLDIAVADDGTMYVTGYGGNSVRVYDQRGTLTTRWGDIELETNAGGGLYGITIGPSGDIYVNSERSVARVRPNGEVVDTWVIEDGSLPPMLFPTGSVAVDDEGTIFMPNTSRHRIVGLSDSGETVLEIEDDRQDRFSTPGGIAVGSDGAIYVADTSLQQVIVLSPDGEVLDTVQWNSTAGPRIGMTLGDVALTEDHMYVIDGQSIAMVKLTRAGDQVDEWTGSPMGEESWSMPRKVVTTPDGSILLLDHQGPAVLQYSTDGEFLGQWDQSASGPEQGSAAALAVQGDTVYASYLDGSMPGIWTLDSEGNALERLVEFVPNDSGGLDTIAAGLAVTPSGDMFTVDPFSRTVRWYSPDGDLRSEWAFGSEDGRAQFANIAVSDTGAVYVSDGDTRQILVFEPVP